MNLKAAAVFFWVCLVGTAAMAGNENGTRIEIAVDDETSGEQSFLFDSREAGFDLHSMAVGESRLLTSESGGTADLRRTADGFEIEVDGKTVDLMAFDEFNDLHAQHDVEIQVDGVDSSTVGIKGTKKVKIIKTDAASAITVISDSTIDAATRSRIQEALEAGGHDQEILYVDGSEFHSVGNQQAHGRHEVHIIKKEVDVTN
jgi:hypothetical protein